MSKKLLNPKNYNFSGPPAEVDWDYFTPLQIKVQHNNAEKAFKIFRSLVQSERIISKWKEKQAYEKPSVKRRRKHAEAMQYIEEMKIKEAKIASGEFEREKERKLQKKERKLKEKEERNKKKISELL